MARTGVLPPFSDPYFRSISWESSGTSTADCHVPDQTTWSGYYDNDMVWCCLKSSGEGCGWESCWHIELMRGQNLVETRWSGGRCLVHPCPGDKHQKTCCVAVRLLLMALVNGEPLQFPAASELASSLQGVVSFRLQKGLPRPIARKNPDVLQRLIGAASPTSHRSIDIQWNIMYCKYVEIYYVSMRDIILYIYMSTVSIYMSFASMPYNCQRTTLHLMKSVYLSVRLLLLVCSQTPTSDRWPRLFGRFLPQLHLVPWLAVSSMPLEGANFS